MKRKISYIIVLLLGVMAMAFYSCEEKDDYNYNNIEPIIFSLDGPSPATAHGSLDFPTRYSVPHRGGSTYEWTVGGYGGTIIPDEEFTSVAHVTFNQSSENTSATITVTETTAGGKVSDPFTRTIQLNAFCPYDMDYFKGNYAGTSGAHDATVVMTPAYGLNLMKVSGLAWFVPNLWGENWTKGDGSCIMEFSCGDVVNIYPQWIGDTDYPDVYGIIGTGTVDVDAKVITLNYQVYYGWTGTTGGLAADVNTTLTLGAKYDGTVKFDIPKPIR